MANPRYPAKNRFFLKDQVVDFPWFLYSQNKPLTVIDPKCTRRIREPTLWVPKVHPSDVTNLPPHCCGSFQLWWRFCRFDLLVDLVQHFLLESKSMGQFRMHKRQLFLPNKNHHRCWLNSRVRILFARHTWKIHSNPIQCWFSSVKTQVYWWHQFNCIFFAYHIPCAFPNQYIQNQYKQ